MDNYEEIVIHSNIDSYLDDVKELEKEWLEELLSEFDIDISEYLNAVANCLKRWIHQQHLTLFGYFSCYEKKYS